MIVLYSILDSSAKKTSLFFAWCIPTSPFIHLNDFCTCFTYFLLTFARPPDCRLLTCCAVLCSRGTEREQYSATPLPSLAVDTQYALPISPINKSL